MSVQLALLGFLLERDYHGYDLKKTIERMMGQWTDIKFGSIYHALGSLERAGHVRKVATLQSEGKPARSIYSITQDGRVEFLKLLRDNLIHPRRLILQDDIGVFFGGGVSREELEEVIDNRTRLILEFRDTLTNHRDRLDHYAPDYRKIAYLLVSRHILHLEAEIEWCRHLRQEVRTGMLYGKDTQR